MENYATETNIMFKANNLQAISGILDPICQQFSKNVSVHKINSFNLNFITSYQQILAVKQA